TERLGLALRIRLLLREIRDAGVRGIHRGLELVRGLLVALGVLARDRDGALERLFAAQGFLEWVVCGSRDLLADEQSNGRQRDDGRAQPALPPPTSPAIPGSIHERMVPLTVA